MPKNVIALLIFSVPALVYAYPQGPDAGYAGVPGEWICSQCHTGNFGSGSVTVSFPGGYTYTPGTKQHLVVTIADPVQRRWGFELTVRQANNSAAQAGSFTPGPEGYTQLVCSQTTFQTQAFGSSCPASMPLQYIEQTLVGTQSGSLRLVSFEFDWTPPDADVGNVVVYVAGNAANGDNSVMGDHIYSQRYTLSAAPSSQPPVITSVGNAASADPVIAAGSWVTITGANLANSRRVWGTGDIVSGMLPTALDGVSVAIDGHPAFVSSVSPTQIIVQTPSDDSLGPVSVVVNNNSASSAPFVIAVQRASPGFYLWSGKYPVATNGACVAVGPPSQFAGVTAPPAQPDGVLTLWGMGLGAADPTADCGVVCPPGLFDGVSAAPAKPGAVVVLWGNGFGVTSPLAPPGQKVPEGQVDSVVNPPRVLIGGISAPVLSATLAPGQAGLYRIAIQIPDGLADGDQPVTTELNGFQSSAVVMINVQN